MSRPSPVIEHRTRLSLVLFACAAMLGCACGTRSEPAHDRAASGTSATPGTPSERTSTPRAVAARPVTPSSAPITVTFPTDDGVEIVGSLRVGTPGTTPIVLVHQLGSTHSEWDPLVEKLAEIGLTTLAIDLRGHGESTHGAGSASTRTYAFDSFQDVDWRATQKDVRAAVDFLMAREDLQAAHVALVGSSIGGTACIAEAAEDPRVERLVMLSPGRAYHGFDAILPAPRLGDRPLLVLHSNEELPSAETSDVLDRVVANSTVRTVTGSAHGVAMFHDEPAQLAAVVDFLRPSSAAP